MDSITAAGPFFDDGCLDSTAANSKDYIAIPFAEVAGEPHSLFCGDSLNGEELTCK